MAERNEFRSNGLVYVVLRTDGRGITLARAIAVQSAADRRGAVHSLLPAGVDEARLDLADELPQRLSQGLVGDADGSFSAPAKCAALKPRHSCAD